MIDLDGIRKRDALAYLPSPYPINPEGSIADRRALLAYVDALREAAGKVTCHTCIGTGLSVLRHDDGARDMLPCPDCADLRALLERQP